MAAAGGSPEIGTLLLQRYRLDARLGEGPDGVVYRAFDTALAEAVAVKVFDPALFTGPDRPTNLFRASRVLAYRHEHIVRVSDVQVGIRPPFIVGELAEGAATFDAFVRSRGLVQNWEIIELFRQFESALELVHRFGAHGNLHPGNVLVRNGRQVLLTDAYHLVGGSTSRDPITALFRAPEQRQNGIIDDPASDMWALGLLLGMALVRSPVHPGVRLSAQGPGIPYEADAVFLRATEPDPRRRFGSIAEFAEAVRTALPGEAAVVEAVPVADTGAAGVEEVLDWSEDASDEVGWSDVETVAEWTDQATDWETAEDLDEATLSTIEIAPRVDVSVAAAAFKEPKSADPKRSPTVPAAARNRGDRSNSGLTGLQRPPTVESLHAGSNQTFAAAAPLVAASVVAASVEPVPVAAAPFEPVPAVAAPVVAAPVVAVPVAPAPVVAAPVELAPMVTAPVAPAPMVTAPVAPAPVVTAPVAPAPMVTAPVEPAPVVAAPVEPTPVVSAPVEPAPVVAAPAEPASLEPVAVAAPAPERAESEPAVHVDVEAVPLPAVAIEPSPAAAFDDASSPTLEIQVDFGASGLSDEDELGPPTLEMPPYFAVAVPVPVTLVVPDTTSGAKKKKGKKGKGGAPVAAAPSAIVAPVVVAAPQSPALSAPISLTKSVAESAPLPRVVVPPSVPQAVPPATPAVVVAAPASQPVLPPTALPTPTPPVPAALPIAPPVVAATPPAVAPVVVAAAPVAASVPASVPASAVPSAPASAVRPIAPPAAPATPMPTPPQRREPASAKRGSSWAVVGFGAFVVAFGVAALVWSSVGSKTDSAPSAKAGASAPTGQASPPTAALPAASDPRALAGNTGATASAAVMDAGAPQLAPTAVEDAVDTTALALAADDVATVDVGAVDAAASDAMAVGGEVADGAVADVVADATALDTTGAEVLAAEVLAAEVLAAGDVLAVDAVPDVSPAADVANEAMDAHALADVAVVADAGEPGVVADVAAPVDAGAGVTVAADTGSAPDGGAASAGADLRLVPPELVACPKGMVKISRKITIDSNGQKQPGYETYCIDRREYGGGAPRTGVSLGGARGACAQRGGRLCSGTEWRRACGGTYPYGSVYDESKCNTMSLDGASREVVASGSFPGCKNGYGLVDMVGNVGEWTADGMVRGGDSYKTGQEATCGYAKRRAPDSGSPFVGFRCCADPTLGDAPTEDSP